MKSHSTRFRRFRYTTIGSDNNFLLNYCYDNKELFSHSNRLGMIIRNYIIFVSGQWL